jgi:hypothetical protein
MRRFKIAFRVIVSFWKGFNLAAIRTSCRKYAADKLIFEHNIKMKIRRRVAKFAPPVCLCGNYAAASVRLDRSVFPSSRNYGYKDFRLYGELYQTALTFRRSFARKYIYANIPACR